MTRLPVTTNSLHVYIEEYGGKPVHNLGSCIVYLHNGNQTFRVLCQVTDTNGYFILGREQTQQMNYISYPDIQPPTCTFTPKTCLNTITTETQVNWSPIQGKDSLRQVVSENKKAGGQSTVIDMQTDAENSSKNEYPITQQKEVSHTSISLKLSLREPVVLDTEWRDSEVMVNDRMHKIPTTKEYLLRVCRSIPRSWKSTRTTLPY